MSTSIRMGAIAGVLLAATVTMPFAAEDLNGREAITNVVSTVLIAENTAVPLGDPIKISLSVKYQGDRETNVAKTATVFDRFEVTDPDEQPVPYVGWVGQIEVTTVRIQPASTVTITNGLDLTDNYVFQKTGRYSIQFRGARAFGETIILPVSNRITVDVTPGQLSQLDQIVVQLLPILPKGWHISKSGRNQQEVAPFGRPHVPGYRAEIFLRRMAGEDVNVWLTKAPLDPDQKPVLKSEYLGRTRGLYVYVAVESKATLLWPKAVDDISRVLQIASE